ncbi:Uncharacterised protein [Vibrio cholerae]|nr:Uncharacterised protein [Vibrio cholerae]
MPCQFQIWQPDRLQHHAHRFAKIWPSLSQSHLLGSADKPAQCRTWRGYCRDGRLFHTKTRLLLNCCVPPLWLKTKWLECVRIRL